MADGKEEDRDPGEEKEEIRIRASSPIDSLKALRAAMCDFNTEEASISLTMVEEIIEAFKAGVRDPEAEEQEGACPFCGRSWWTLVWFFYSLSLF